MGRLLCVLALGMVGCGEGDSDELCTAGAASTCTLPDGREGTSTCGADFRPGPCVENVDAAVDAAPVIAPPMPPEAAAWSCPPGWSASAGACEPFPADGPSTCAAGEAHFPGEPDCSAVGAACPIGPFADALPTDVPIVYVLEGAVGGDGTRALPYGGLTEFSLGRLRRGSTIAIGPGTYDVTLRLPSELTLWGACAARTTLTSTSPSEDDAVVTPVGTGTAVRDLTIGPSPRRGVKVDAGTELLLSGVAVVGNQSTGLAVQGNLMATRLVVGDTDSRRSDRRFGYGIELLRGGVATLSRAIIENNRVYGLRVADPETRLDLDDAVVRDTRSDELTLLGGRGVHIETGAVVRAGRTLLDANRDIGLLATDTGTRLDAADIIVRDTQSLSSDGTFGRGLQVQRGAVADVVRMLVATNRELGVQGSEPETDLRLEQLVVRDTRGRAMDDRFGRGLEVRMGARVDVGHVLFEHNREVAILARDADVLARFEHITVRDTIESDGRGRAVSAHDGASVTLSRAILERSWDVAVAISAPGTTTRLEDAMVRETRNGGEAAFGRGLDVSAGGEAEVVRAIFEDHPLLAVAASSSDARLQLTDVVVRDTTSRESDGEFGIALVVWGAETTVERALFERSRDVGVVNVNEGTLAATGVVISETLPADCVASSCPSSAGHGLFTGYAASTTLSNFAVRDAAVCGVMVVHDADLDLSNGEISGCSIGACVQVDGYDVSRLNDRVAYRGNGVNLDATDLPIPTIPAGPAEP